LRRRHRRFTKRSLRVDLRDSGSERLGLRLLQIFGHVSLRHDRLRYWFEAIALERHLAIGLARNAVIALLAAIDQRAGKRTREHCTFAENPFADRPRDVGSVRIKPDQRVAQRRRNRRADRPRNAEVRLVDGAERRGKGPLL